MRCDSAGGTTSFDHLFQSGRASGTLTIDGVTTEVDQWWSQRDRSRGLRTMAGGQGLHIWYQAQLPDRSVGFLLVESRDGSGERWTTIGVSANIIDASFEALYESITYKLLKTRGTAA